MESGGERTTELLHASLFTAHAYALQCRPNAALDALDRYEVELSRRHVPRFAGRASNFRGWILRALGQWERADEANKQAIDELGTIAFPEALIAAHLDLAYLRCFATMHPMPAITSTRPPCVSSRI